MEAMLPLKRTAIQFRCALMFLFTIGATSGLSNSAAQESKVDFIKDVQPILAKKCFACHGPDEAEGGLRFTSKEAAFAETESGEHALVSGDVEASALIARITTDDEFERMPPEGDAVSPEEVETLTRWIQQGAKWDKHWAFLPMQRHEPPQVDDRAWNKNPIDAFVYASLAEQQLTPNPPADRTHLLRRAYYDLIGLPPTQSQIESFANDTSPSAFSDSVNQLLDSQHYGERFARYWLDLVRYAETNSYERDSVKPNAWKYRDYVIKSFNDDKPYDQFVREQIAGDELDDVTMESLTATGYYRLGVWDDEPVDEAQARFDALDDIIMTTGQAFLGLTINCARCHDHKIDPIPQADYYSMLSFLEDLTPYANRRDLRTFNQIDISSGDLRAKYAANTEEKRGIETAMEKIEQAGIVKMPAPDQRATEGTKRDRNRVLKEKLRDHLDDGQWAKYQKLKRKLKSNAQALQKLPPRESVMGLAKYRKVDKPTFVLFRGNPGSPSDEVTPSFPTIFDAEKPAFPSQVNDADTSSGRRRVLADWIASEENMLTARVMANRIWQYHFGRGIVRSSNNFGQLGSPPTHPELLDWLAYKLIDSGWRLKPIHRLIMSSQTYQMSSAANDDGIAKDPNNSLFWRFNPRRLSAEEVRDSILVSNGSLNRKVYGPSMYPTLSKEVVASQSKPGDGWGKSTPEQENRRSIYIHVKRSLVTPLLSAFDFPDPDLTCEARFMTLQPGQALSMMNSDFIHAQADRLLTHVGGSEQANEQIVRQTVQAVLGRDASEKEIAEGNQLITSLESKEGVSRKRAAQLYCLTVINWNEFLFID
ncbi:Planctomycete cytochrome C [Planctomycetes bacterium K23_9]|uniref:Planctomycete cytochrome C n=2 Tax=Stieleria marina TaxID=1930275 RepID=A0A517NQ31_9BACT|nr:Planctomycete cytochrome C [Planctomycetes bacterium K23_9]